LSSGRVEGVIVSSSLQIHNNELRFDDSLSEHSDWSKDVCQFYMDKEAAVDDRVENLLARMLLNEKINRMKQAGRGSVT
jgi:hypothetical protein